MADIHGYPDGCCPVCGKPVLHSLMYRAWACQDPGCVLAQSDDGPGGGFPIETLMRPSP